MGDWGFSPFQNDVAADWVLELEVLPAAERIAKASAALVEASRTVPLDDESLGDEAVAAAAWLLGPGLEITFEEVPTSAPPVLDDDLRALLQNAISHVIAPDSAWMIRQWEAGSEAIEPVMLLSAALGGPSEPAVLPSNSPEDLTRKIWATVSLNSTVEAESQRLASWFRVSFFRESDNGWVARHADLTDCDLLEAFEYGDQNAGTDELLAISVLSNDTSGSVTQTWLVGKDPGTPDATDQDVRHTETMLQMRANAGMQAWLNSSGAVYERLASSQRELESALERRNAAVLEAEQAQVPWTHIAEVTGLSPESAT